MAPNPMTPFPDDPSYLQEEIGWLDARCRRLVVERELRDQIKNDDPRQEESQQVVTLGLQKERRLRAELDARLAHHHRHGTFVLGLDKLCMEADLDANGRTVLLCCFTAAVSEDLAAETFRGLDFAIYVSMTIEGLGRVLEADTVADRLRLHRMFEPEAPLIKHGLVVLDGKLRREVPEDLNGMNVKLSARACRVMTGQEEVG